MLSERQNGSVFLEHLLREAPWHFEKREAIIGNEFLKAVDSKGLHPTQDGRDLDKYIETLKEKLGSSQRRLEELNEYENIDMVLMVKNILDGYEQVPDALLMGGIIGRVHRIISGGVIEQEKLAEVANQLYDVLIGRDHRSFILGYEEFNALLGQVRARIDRMKENCKEELRSYRERLDNMTPKASENRERLGKLTKQGFRTIHLLNMITLTPSSIEARAEKRLCDSSKETSYVSSSSETLDQQYGPPIGERNVPYVRIVDIYPCSVTDFKKAREGETILTRGNVVEINSVKLRENAQHSFTLSSDNRTVLCGFNNYLMHPIDRKLAVLGRDNGRFVPSTAENILALLHGAKTTRQDIYLVGRKRPGNILSVDTFILGYHAIAYTIENGIRDRVAGSVK